MWPFDQENQPRQADIPPPAPAMKKKKKSLLRRTVELPFRVAFLPVRVAIAIPKKIVTTTIDTVDEVADSLEDIAGPAIKSLALGGMTIGVTYLALRAVEAIQEQRGKQQTKKKDGNNNKASSSPPWWSPVRLYRRTSFSSPGSTTKSTGGGGLGGLTSNASPYRTTSMRDMSTPVKTPSIKTPSVLIRQPSMSANTTTNAPPPLNTTMSSSSPLPGAPSLNTTSSLVGVGSLKVSSSSTSTAPPASPFSTSGVTSSTPLAGSTAPGHSVPLLDRATELHTDPVRGEVSLTTYNVLADIYSTPKRYPYAEPRVLQWDYRYTLLQSEMRTTNADIVCLQEVDPNKFYDWKRVMRSMGYDGVVQDRGVAGSLAATGGGGGGARKLSGTLHVNATFWKMDKLTLVSVEHGARSLITAFAQQDERRLLVANCHLEANPMRPQDRIVQIKNVLTVLERMRNECVAARLPVASMVVGDLNCERDSSVYRLLATSKLEKGATEPYLPGVPLTDKALAHSLKLRDVYVEAGAVPHYTCKTPAASTVIDHVFVSSDVETMAVVRPMNARDRYYANKTYLPSKAHPSDHVPLTVMLR